MWICVEYGKSLVWKIGGAVLVAGGVSVVLAAPTLAAMNATLSPTHGYPGLREKVMTDDYGNSTAYDFIASQPPQSVYLIGVAEEAREVDQFGEYVCGTGAQTPIGRLKWKADTGTLDFTVPYLSKGEYHFLINVGEGVSKPPCWRIDGPNGPLTLTIGDRPAEAPSTSTSQPSGVGRSAVLNTTPVWAAVVVGVFSVILVVVCASIVIRRRGSSRRPHTR